MSSQALWDARQPGVFFIEADAVRYIRTVGPAAWAVYTFLVYSTSHAGRPVNFPPLTVIAERCGVSEHETESALNQLVRYRLLEVADERHGSSESVIRVYRIPGVDPTVERLEPAAEMPASPEAEEHWERERDEGQRLRRMFDALVQVSGYEDREIDEATRDDIFTAVTSILAAGGDAEQIRAAAELYRKSVPDLQLTPRNLAAAWGLLSAVLVLSKGTAANGDQ